MMSKDKNEKGVPEGTNEGSDKGREKSKPRVHPDPEQEARHQTRVKLITEAEVKRNQQGLKFFDENGKEIDVPAAEDDTDYYGGSDDKSKGPNR